MSNDKESNYLPWGSVLYFLFMMFRDQPWFWSFFVILVLALIIIVVFFEKDKTSNTSGSSTQEPSNNQTNQTQSSTNVSPVSSNNQTNQTQSSRNRSLQNIEWTEIGTYYSNNTQTNESSAAIEFDSDFFNNKNQKTDELLHNLIGQKDRVTGELFNHGEKVYFCISCQLGYHEDSWQFLDRKCEQCKSSNVRFYTLPLAEFRDVKLNKSKSDIHTNSQKNYSESQPKHRKRTVEPINWNNIAFSEMTASEEEDYIHALDLDTICRNIGKKVKIKGQIRSVRVDRTNNIIYFDFAENTYAGFYAYVNSNHGHQFTDPMSYEYKNVVISGTLSLNSRNQPRIKLANRSQLREI